MDETDKNILIHNSLDTAEFFLSKNKTESVLVALKTTEQALACDPNNARAIQILGSCNYWLGDINKAKSCFESILSGQELWITKPINETQADALNSLAACFYSQGDVEKSVFYLQNAINLCNKNCFLRNLDLINGKQNDSKPKVLVGSVFADDDEVQSKWLDLQLDFLKRNTENFDHVVCLDKESTGSFKDKTKVIKVRSEPHFYVHIWGLRELMNYFLKVKNDYDFFLILDSDAFPTKPWLENLIQKMSPTQCVDSNGFCFFNCGLNYEIASIVRSENFEVRLHASVLFMKKESLEDISFEHENAGINLINQVERDIVIPKYEFEKKNSAFPLIRTNQYNVHPLISGIYFDSFYHHGAGSRNLRHSSDGYHDYQTSKSTEYYRDLLFGNPQKFVSDLAGWK